MKKTAQLKIFLVDDDLFSLEVHKQHLHNLGYADVRIYTDGQQCLNDLVEQPAVVFIDHMMEPMDGLKLLKKIKRFDPNILIVFISGQEDLAVAVDALKYGAFDYLIKGADLLDRMTGVMHKIESMMAQLTAAQKKKWFKLFPSLNFLWLLLIVLSSCASQNMFQKDPSIKEDPTVFVLDTNYQYRIRIDDKISISVWDHDDLSVGSIYGIYNSNEVYGKWLLVDARGNISVPQIGEVQVLGKSVLELEQQFREAYARYIKSPIVEVKVLNKEVTILGEIKSPGKLLLEKEHNSLVEAIGRAGDFDFYADRTHVQVIRHVNGEPKSVTVDLSLLKNYSSSNVYLQPGDVVYIPSRKSKVWDKRSGSIVVPATAIITTAVLVATTLR